MNNNGKMRRMDWVDCAYLILTEDCNLNCTYCFEQDKCAGTKMPIEIAKRTVDYLFANAQLNNSRKFSIIFFGGEPMLAPDIMSEVIEYAYRITSATDINPIFSIITNGTIWNDKVKEFFDVWHEFAGKNMTIQLSIDGIPEIQNKNRPSKSGKKSSDMIEFAVGKYREYFMEHNIPVENIYIHACVSHDTINYMARSYDYFWDTLKVRSQFAWVFESNWDNDEDSKTLYHELSKINSRALFKDITPNKWPLKHFDQCSGCSVGRSLVAVDTAGNLYPCHRFFFYTKSHGMNDFEKILFGHIYNWNPDEPLGEFNNPIDEKKRKPFKEYQSTKVCDQPAQVCAACNFENTGDMYKIVNDTQIHFMKVINQLYKEYENAYNQKHNIIKADSNSCDNNGKCNCKSQNDDSEIYEKLVGVIEVLDRRIEILESKIAKYEKLGKIWEVINEDE